MSKRTPLSRRTVLRGLGMSLALPWLEAMESFGAATSENQPADAPNRMLLVYVPNGKVMSDWTPKQEGPLSELPPILAPLEKVKSNVMILSGMTTHPGSSGDGGHARAMGGFLTGTMINKSEGAAMRAGISVDQAAAEQVGNRTRVSSLQIGCERGAMAGNCDAGFSCAYTTSMSWKSATQPLPKEVDPALVFDRLFGAVSAQQRKNERSILDFIRGDSQDLQARLGADDRRKLDQYFTAVREVESRIARAETLPEQIRPVSERPSGIPADYQQHLRLMGDLIALAFQADATRICTFMMANELSNRAYPDMGISEGHHDLTHGNAVEKVRAINVFHASQLAYLLEKLQAIPERDGTLLDHSMVVYGSGLSDGFRHTYDNLPILLAGKGAGSLNPGRHVRYPAQTPLSNLWVSLLDRMDAKMSTLGDSTGRLPNLSD